MTVRRIAAALVALVVLSGCTSPADHSPAPTKPPTYPNWPELLAGFRFRWTAGPGIELLTGPAVPLRAFVESYWVGVDTSDVDSDVAPKFASYPGFLNAVAQPTGVEGTIPYQITYAWPFPGMTYSGEPLYGNEYLHVLRIDLVDGGYRAYVCDGRYNTFFHDRATNTYTSVVRWSKNDDSLIQLWRVEMRRPSPAPPSATEQKGPSPAPLGDVLEDWSITASNMGLWGMRNSPESREYRPIAATQHQQCLGAMPHPADQFGPMSRREFGSPPPFEQAVPGWAAQAS
jgi:hypothetical protein